MNVMMTFSNGNLFPRYWPLCGEFTGHRWIPLTKASDAEPWCFLWINSWVNNREAGYLRRHRTHYSVIVMSCHRIYINGKAAVCQTNRSSKQTTKETSRVRITGYLMRTDRLRDPHEKPIMRKVFPSHGVIMLLHSSWASINPLFLAWP